MTENWRSLPGFEEAYSVSDAGRVCRLERVVMRSNGRRQTLGSKILKGGKDSDGYLQVRINGVLRSVHCLVALTFIGPCPENLETCHNDGDRVNNRASNIRYDTHKGNSDDRKIHGTEAIGSKRATAKLNETTARDALIRSKAGESNASIARDLGVNPSTIFCLVNRKTWIHIDV